MLPLSVTVLVIAGMLRIPAPGQGLGELAAREKERRKGLTARLYTDEDLRHVSQQREGYASSAASDPAPALSAAAGNVPAAARKEGEGVKSEDDLRAEREKDWRDRLQKARDDVTRLSADIERLQLGLNDLSQNLYGAGRRAQIDRLGEAKGQLVAAQQSIEGLEEEGRRSSFRP